jgi:hypothetical protein
MSLFYALLPPLGILVAMETAETTLRAVIFLEAPQ